MSNGSAALFRAANLRILDYPFEAALASALSVCDEAVIVVGQSEDDTRSRVQALAKQYTGRVTVTMTTFHYDRMWQERWWELAASLTDADWLMYHDADECIHEDDAPMLRGAMAHPHNALIRFDMWHFYATVNFQKVNYIARRNARIGRRSQGWKMQNWCSDGNPDWPACQMIIGGGQEAHSAYQGAGIVEAPGPLFHYGHCRNAQALAISREKHRAWYANGDGLTNGRIPRVNPWDFELAKNLDNGTVVPYEGNHPAALTSWRAEHAAEWAELEQSVQVMA